MEYQALTEQQLNELRKDLTDGRANGTTAWYKHAPDGAYDFVKFGVRYLIIGGFPYLVAASSWVDDPVANLRLPEWMRLPWGSYPDIPPKPPK